MKNATVAFTLSFLLPGGGLAYLGRWKLAAANLAAALGIGLVLVLLLPEHALDVVDRWAALVVGSFSGAWAMQTTEEMNKKASERPTLDELADEAKLG